LNQVSFNDASPSAIMAMFHVLFSANAVTLIKARKTEKAEHIYQE